MKQKTFKDLLIWQKSQELIEEIVSELRKWKYDKLNNELAEQVYRSVQSIGANIAEGYGRGSNKDFERFLIIARGSLSETDHWLYQAQKENLITKEKYDNLSNISTEISKMLASFISKLRKFQKR